MRNSPVNTYSGVTLRRGLSGKPQAVIWGLLALIYFLLVCLHHEHVGAWMAQYFNIGDRVPYNRRFAWFGIFGGLIYLSAVIPKLYHRRDTLLLALLGATLALVVSTMPILLVLNSELIHYPQYALLTLMLIPVCRSPFLAVVISSLLGTLDEGYQYFYLASAKMSYFDFNDVILNLWGSVLGAILGIAYLRGYLTNAKGISSAWMLIGSVLIVLGVLWSLNVLDFIPPRRADDPAAFTLSKEKTTHFWKRISHGVVFHVVRPAEGITVLLLLSVVYQHLDRFKRSGP